MERSPAPTGTVDCLTISPTANEQFLSYSELLDLQLQGPVLPNIWFGYGDQCKVVHRIGGIELWIERGGQGIYGLGGFHDIVFNVASWSKLL